MQFRFFPQEGATSTYSQNYTDLTLCVCVYSTAAVFTHSPANFNKHHVRAEISPLSGSPKGPQRSYGSLFSLLYTSSVTL